MITQEHINLINSFRTDMLKHKGEIFKECKNLVISIEKMFSEFKEKDFHIDNIEFKNKQVNLKIISPFDCDLAEESLIELHEKFIAWEKLVKTSKNEKEEAFDDLLKVIAKFNIRLMRFEKSYC